MGYSGRVMKDSIQTITLAELYLAQGHPRRADAVARKLLEKQPGDVRVLALIERIAKYSETEANSEESPVRREEEQSLRFDWQAFTPVEQKKKEVSRQENNIEAQVGQETRKVVQEEPATLRERAVDLGTEVVERLASHAGDRLSRMLDRIRERRRR